MTAPEISMTGARRRAPWYVETFLAFGGWIAGLFAAAAIVGVVATFMTRLDTTGAAAAVALLGAAFIGTGTALARPKGGDFLRHFAIAAIAAGFTAFAAGAWYLAYKAVEGALPDTTPVAILLGNAGLAAGGVFAVVAFVVARRVDDGILTFLVTLALFAIGAISLAALQSERVLLPFAFKAYPASAALLGVVLFTRKLFGRIAIAVGAALMIGPMLFYESWARARALGGMADLRADAFEAAVYGAAVLYCLYLLRSRFAALPLLAGAALLLAGIWFLSASGSVAIVILLAGMAAAHRGLAAIGVLALAFFLGRFYHDLSLTLLTKSAILAGLGAAALAGALFLRKLLGDGVDLSRPRPAPARRPLAATLAVGALLGGALLLVNRQVLDLETGFAHASEILLPLGPVDPRSIIQGDYMILNFRETIYPTAEEIAAAPKAGEIFLALDEMRVARFSRFAAPGDAPQDGEIRIDYAKSAFGALLYCPESFFFQEGEGDIFAVARFAVLKVAPDGRARLVALADDERRTIDPSAERRIN